MQLLYEHTDFAEFLEYCHRPSELPEHMRISRCVQNHSAWFGTKTFDEAVQLALMGCRDLEEDVRRMSHIFLEQTGLGSHDYSPFAVYDTGGDEVDVARYLSGEPESMCSWHRETVWRPIGRVLTITVQSAFACSVTPSQLAARGAAILSLVIAAEHAGYRVELNSVYAIANLQVSKLSAIIVCIKQADQQIDLSRLAFVLMHPASLRRLGFSYMETLSSEYHSTFNVACNGTYGLIDPELEKTALAMFHRADMYIGSYEWEQFNTEASTVRWLHELAQNLGLVETNTRSSV